LRKRKKKTKTIDIDSVLSGGSSSAAVDNSHQTPHHTTNDEEKEQVQVGGQSELLESLESFGLKKKKKTKKILTEDNNEELSEGKLASSNLMGDEMLGDEMSLDIFGQKKKKKSSRKVMIDDQGGDNDAPGEDMIIGDEDDSPSETSSATPRTIVSEKSWLNSDRDYTYDELLTRVFEIMHAKNPEMASGTKQKFVMRPPQVIRVGTKKNKFCQFYGDLQNAPSPSKTLVRLSPLRIGYKRVNRREQSVDNKRKISAKADRKCSSSLH